MIPDGALIYAEAFKKEYWTFRGPMSKRIRHLKFDGDRNNNKMERTNAEIRDREKIMRGLKKRLQSFPAIESITTS